MDHLPPVSSPHNPVQVPYLGGVYDGKDFAGYPLRENWNLSRLQEGNLAGRSLADAQRFLQTWLFFGMLHEVLGLEVLADDFVRVDDSQAFITTDKLRSYLHTWKSLVESEMEEGPAEVSLKRDQRVTDALAFSCTFWRGIDDGVRSQLIAPEVELSIQILAVTLEHAVTSVCDVPVELAPWRLTRSSFVTGRMIRDGWCPGIIEQVWYPAHLSLLYYISLLGPPTERLRHDRCVASDRLCEAKKMDDATYQTKHAREGCKCEFVGPDVEQLASIVKDGGTPILCFEDGESGPLLKIVKFGKGMQYTAISHVWSDGLGNPHSNTLPLCQIRKMASFVSSLPASQQTNEWDEPGVDRVWRRAKPQAMTKVSRAPTYIGPRYLWMDILCVPVGPQELRSNAVMRMRSVYSRAARVLVMDAEIMRSTMNSSLEEKLSRITCSNWIGRLWTLQEAVLAAQIFFQFDGGYESVSEPQPEPEAEPVAGTYKNRYSKYYDNEVKYFCEQFGYSWRHLPEELNELQRIVKVWLAMKARSTSKIRDEAICMATLLDMNLETLLNAPLGERVKTLWSMYSQVPAAVLFLPGEKLNDAKYGWAPARLRDCTNLGVPLDEAAQVTPQGLLVNLPGFLLTSPEQTPRAVIACELEGKIFYIRQNEKLGSPSWKGLDMSKASKLAVLLGQRRMGDPPQRRPLIACVGALVSVTEERDGRFFVEYIRMVSVIGKSCRYDEYPNPAWSEIEMAEKEVINGAAYTKANQRWCVGSSYQFVSCMTRNALLE